MLKAKEVNLGTEKISTLLKKMTLPVSVSLFVNALYNIIDTIYVGQGVGMEALGGLSVVFPIQMAFGAIGFMIGSGTASVVSRRLGSGNKPEAEHTAGNAILIGLSIAIIAVVLAFVFMKPLLYFVGSTEDIYPYASEYLTYILFGVPSILFSIISNNTVRAEGNAKRVMVIMVLSALINIVLDPIFIFGLNMGVKGAAIATVIARTTAALIYVVYFIRGKGTIRIKREDFKLKFARLKQIFILGLGGFLMQISYSIIVSFMNNQIGVYASRLDVPNAVDIYIAIFGVISRVLIFVMMPLFAIMLGFQPIAGFNWGAENYGRVRKVMKLSLITSITIASAVYILIMIFPEQIISIFNAQPVFVEHGVLPLRLILMVLPLVGIQLLGSGLFVSIGKAIPALILSLSRQVLFLFPLLFILPSFFGLNGLWYAFPVADITSISLAVILIVNEMRKHPVDEKASGG